MTRYWYTAAALALTPLAATAQVELGGQLYLGYGNEGADPGALGLLTLSGENTFQLGGVGALNVLLQGNLRTNQDEIGFIDDNEVEFLASLDMGAYGTLSATNIGTLGQPPWADGNLYDRGSVSVFPGVPRSFRSIGDTAALFVDGELTKVQEDLEIAYTNEFGNLGVEIETDPFKIYGPVSGDEVEPFNGLDRPVAQLNLHYPTGLGIYDLRVNDLGDVGVSVAYPVADTGLLLVVAYDALNEDAYRYNADFTAIYRTEDAGYFRGFFATYTEGTFGLDKAVVSLNFGGERWKTAIAGDSDQDWAIEGGYEISDEITALFGYDSGHEFLDGFDDRFEPPVFAPAREEAYEVGLRFTF